MKRFFRIRDCATLEPVEMDSRARMIHLCDAAVHIGPETLGPWANKAKHRSTFQLNYNTVLICLDLSKLAGGQ